MTEAGLFCQVNTTRDPDNPTPAEQKHTPAISVGGPIKAGESTNVTVKVGSIPHPNENEHFIQWVNLFAGKVFIARFDFTAVMTEPEVTIPIRFYHKGLRTLRAISRCNLHGLWEGSLDVNVE
jgi:superoxide reductase